MIKILKLIFKDARLIWLKLIKIAHGCRQSSVLVWQVLPHLTDVPPIVRVPPLVALASSTVFSLSYSLDWFQPRCSRDRCQKEVQCIGLTIHNSWPGNYFRDCRPDDDTCVPIDCENIRLSLVEWYFSVRKTKLLGLPVVNKPTNCSNILIWSHLEQLVQKLVISLLPYSAVYIFSSSALNNCVYPGIDSGEETDCSMGKCGTCKKASTREHTLYG